MKLRVRSVQSILVVLIIGVAAVSVANTFQLPTRSTPRPATTDGVPHVQIDIEPRPELYDELLRRVSGIAHVEVSNTIVSLPGALTFLACG